MSLIGRKTRVEASLLRLERELDRHLLAGEIFRRQILVRQYDDGVFGNVSTRSFAQRFVEDPRTPGYEASNVIRDYWTRAKPLLHLAVGICHGLPRRPSLQSLVFSDFKWVTQAVRQAEQIRQLAIEVRHPLAASLWPVMTEAKASF